MIRIKHLELIEKDYVSRAAELQDGINVLLKYNPSWKLIILAPDGNYPDRFMAVFDIGDTDG